jgi:hypothetical protein
MCYGGPVNGWRTVRQAALSKAGVLGFAALRFVALVRPSTLTGTSPWMVERRTTRVDGIVLGRGIVPDRDVSFIPTPAHRVLELGDM